MENAEQTSIKSTIFLLLTLALLMFANSLEARERQQNGSSKQELTLLANAPVSGFGHGTFFDAQGNPVSMDEKMQERSQQYWLSALEKRVKSDRADSLRGIVRELVDDPLLARALEIDALIQDDDSILAQGISSINHSIRIAYLQQLKGDALKELGPLGVGKQITKRLADRGLRPFADTENSGGKYIEECREAGVPIPPPMYTRDWDNRGVFSDEFISDDLTAELWLYESKEPAGACLALPRYFSSDPNTADLLGLICLGKKSSKACFWDNPSNQAGNWPRGVERPIEDFVGGAALPANGQGTCTNCHAGENPFVVHPDVGAFAGLTGILSSDDWHEPIVVPTWPQNPGPIDLSGVDSDQRCDSCHTQNYAGRFPDVTAGLNQYCSAVLRTSLLGDTLTPRAIQTMPQSGSFAGHFKHIDHLLSLCFGGTTGGGDDDDRENVSPPIVLGPLYACATKVAVSGSVLDAEVSLYIDGSLIDTKKSRSPSKLEFDVPDLKVGETVVAEQIVDGIPSGFSAPVVVRDHKADYPAGLPAPDIDPDLIYECGHTVAVRHVPGAKLTVMINSGNDRTISTSTGWTGMYPGKYPFNLSDEFVAEISLCDDVSPTSSPEFAVSAPSVTTAPTLDPNQTYEGQELLTLRDILNGSMVTIDEASTGNLDKFSTPVSRVNERDIASKLGRPLQSGDQILLQQHLCDSGPVGETPPTQRCKDIPAPRIRLPFDGDTQVVITESVPGARIRIFAGGVELGDGSGSPIALNRALNAGETVTVTQQVGECFSQLAYRIEVQPRPVRKRDEDKG